LFIPATDLASGSYVIRVQQGGDQRAFKLPLVR
jgi:hypothetical protein